ncbi:MAG TPA: ATP-binding protein [Flavipsychrobacter sp.]|nr:ATP-binding protein [Flavipsychrobacter sp.]
MNEYLLPLFIFGSIVLMLFAISLTALLMMQRRRQINHILEKENLEIAHKNELLTTRLEVQERSMTLISEEIHDNVGQLLTLSRTYLSMLKQQGNEQTNTNLVNRTFELVTNAITDLRHISHGLNGKLISETGLVQFLEKDVEHIAATPGLSCSLNVEGNYYSLSHEQNLLVYRITQESIQNVLKHAQADKLGIILTYQEDRLEVKITDNGKGFETEGLNYESLGLRNMFLRAKLLNGDLKIVSSLGSGTQILLYIPKV